MAIPSTFWPRAMDAIARAFLPAPAAPTDTGGSILKCPRCNAWAEVKETRARDDNTMRRRYECANLHRFTTIECVRTDSVVTRRNPERANKSQED